MLYAKRVIIKKVNTRTPGRVEKKKTRTLNRLLNYKIYNIMWWRHVGVYVRFNDDSLVW